MGPLPLSVPAHDYQQFSGQYSTLQIEGSYFLAFSSIPDLIQRYDKIGKRALDFGCGTGRSTRFLQGLGLDVAGADINPSMLAQAQQLTNGTSFYRLDSETLPFEAARFDVIFQSFVLLEYDSISRMIGTFEELNRVLSDEGVIIVVTGSEDYYCHDWASFEMDRSGVQTLTSGCKVKISIRGTGIVLFDYYWTDHDYRSVFQQSGFDVVEVVQPLARGDEPFAWVSESRFPCWTIYVLEKQEPKPHQV